MSSEWEEYRAWFAAAGVDPFSAIDGSGRIHPEIPDEELFEISKTCIDALLDGPLRKDQPYLTRMHGLRELIIDERTKAKKGTSPARKLDRKIRQQITADIEQRAAEVEALVRSAQELVNCSSEHSISGHYGAVRAALKPFLDTDSRCTEDNGPVRTDQES